MARLVKRLHERRYLPQPVRRAYIPKPGSAQQRPLGIPALEDKRVQAGLVRIREQIDEQDFIEDSYGFRPGRGGHDALRARSAAVEDSGTEWIVEADIKGFFDHVQHDWLMRLLEHRVGDRRVYRRVKRFLKAGVFEEGQVGDSDGGTPQGGVISPVLANIYLHYALDLWFERVFRKGGMSPARLIRYADDFVACFATQADAQRFRWERTDRLAQLGLEAEPTKTQVLAFGRLAAQRARKEGKGKPDTFDFLGFTHDCGKTRNGKRFRMKRGTARKKFSAKLAALKPWLKDNRARMKTTAQWDKFREKLRGHFAYYGVTDHAPGIGRFYEEAKKLLFKWLNRRSQRKSMTWEPFNRMDQRYPLPRPRIRVNILRKPKTPVQTQLV